MARPILGEGQPAEPQHVEAVAEKGHGRARGLPPWDLLPPHESVRRRKRTLEAALRGPLPPPASPPGEPRPATQREIPNGATATAALDLTSNALAFRATYPGRADAASAAPSHGPDAPEASGPSEPGPAATSEAPAAELQLSDKVAAPPAPQGAAATAFCVHCGTRLEAGSKFCTDCGSAQA